MSGITQVGGITGNLGTGAGAFGITGSGSGAGVTPLNFILDMQAVSDVFPNVVRLLAWAHSKQIINLLAITNSVNDASNNPTPGAEVVSQILATAGVTGVALSSGPTTTNVTAAESESLPTFLSQAFVPLRRLQTVAGLATSVPVLRSVLAAATSPVVIMTAGPYNNLYDLLNSGADSISSLTGAQLISSRVAMLYSMGGQYPQSTAPVGAEYNFGNIPGFTGVLWPITQAILIAWPTPITFIGFENGPFASCGAQYELTPTDPIGFYYANWATAQFGRQAWNEIAALIAMRGPAMAGFSTVSGSNSINTGTGFNTFTPGAGGSHSYVVPLVSQRALQQSIDSICGPGNTQPATYTAIAETVPITPATAAQIDGVNLINWYFAPDINLANAAPVTSWPDRCGRANLVQATVALQPTYATALIGEVAVSFSGTQALVGDANIDIPHNCTLYAYVECNAFNASFMTVLTHGATSGATNLRDIFMDRTKSTDSPANTPRGQSLIQNTFTAATATNPLTLNTWQVIAIVRSAGQVSCYLNGVAAGSTAIATPANFDSLVSAVSNHIVAPVTVGAQFVNATPAAVNPWNGGIKEIRIYNNAHSPTQVAAVSTAMTT